MAARRSPSVTPRRRDPCLGDSVARTPTGGQDGGARHCRRLGAQHMGTEGQPRGVFHGLELLVGEAPFGPDHEGPSLVAGLWKILGGSSIGVSKDYARDASQVLKGHGITDSREARPARLQRSLASDPAEPVGRGRNPRRVPLDHRSPTEQWCDLVDSELSETCNNGLWLLPLGQGEGDVQPGQETGLHSHRAITFEGQVRPGHGDYAIRPPPATAVRHRDALARAQTTHSRQVVRVVTADLQRLAQHAVDEHMRRRVFARRPCQLE